MSEVTSPTPALTSRQRHWLEHLKAWQTQELSLKAYAVANSLSVSGLYSAKRYFKAHGIWQGREVSGPQRRKHKLVPVQITPSSATLSSVIRLHFPNGMVVEFPEHVEPLRLQRLMTMLLGASS
jgi:hypothetical protein